MTYNQKALAVYIVWCAWVGPIMLLLAALGVQLRDDAPGFALFVLLSVPFVFAPALLYWGMRPQ